MIKHEIYFKWAVILIGFILFFLIFRRCGSDINYSPIKNDTISVHVDTVWYESRTDTVYIPKVVKEYIPKPIYLESEVHDTLEVESPFRDSLILAYAKDYLKGRLYLDTIRNEYGYVAITDSVSRNLIQSRRISSKILVPTIKEVITLREPKRVVAYLGFDLLGSQQSFLSAAGANFGLQLKNGKQYEIKAFLNKDGTPMYGFGFKLPIRLKSR